MSKSLHHRTRSPPGRRKVPAVVCQISTSRSSVTSNSNVEGSAPYTAVRIMPLPAWALGRRPRPSAIPNAASAGTSALRGRGAAVVLRAHRAKKSRAHVPFPPQTRLRSAADHRVRTPASAVRG